MQWGSILSPKKAMLNFLKISLGDDGCTADEPPKPIANDFRHSIAKIRDLPD